MTALEEIDGAALLEEVAGYLSRYVAFPSEEARDAVVLWAAHCHAVDAFESTPRLALLSPEKESGKTRTLEVLDHLVPASLFVENISVAALFREVDKSRPTLLLDECDTIFAPNLAQHHEDLRGLLNSGHRRGADIVRCVGDGSKQDAKRFSTFCPVALAGIGDLPDTVLSRSVVVRMKRRAAHETVTPLRAREGKALGEPIREKLESWSSDHLLDLAEARPEMPWGVEDRAADVWEPLLAVADAAGETWPKRARAAAAKFVAESRAAEPSLGAQLLRDIRTVFDSTETDKLASEDLIHRLCEMVESPWGDLRGKPLDARGLARRLRQFDIRPKVIRVDDRTPRGFDRDDFWDVWQRYSPDPHPPSTEAQQAQQAQQGRSEGVSRVADENSRRNKRNGSATENMPLTCDVTNVALLADLQKVKEGSAVGACPECAHPGSFHHWRRCSKFSERGYGS